MTRSGRLLSELEALRFDGLEANFRSVTELAPLDQDAYRRILKRIVAALRTDKKSAVLHGLRGKILSNLGRYPEAWKSLTASLKSDGSRAQVRAWLGGVHLLESRFSMAIDELHRAVALDPACGWAFFYLAAARYAIGQGNAASHDLDFIARTSKDPDVRAAGQGMAALLAARRGRPKEAVRLMSRLIDSRKGSGWPYALRALVQADPAVSLKDLDCAIERGAPAWVYAQRAEHHARTGRTGRALEDMSEAVGRDHANLDFLIRRASLLADSRRYDEAIADLKKAASSDPTLRSLRAFALRLGHHLSDGGQKTKAAAFMKDAARRFPDDSDICFYAGELLAQQGRRSAALTLFEKAEKALRRELTRGGKEKHSELARTLSGRLKKPVPGSLAMAREWARILVSKNRFSEAEVFLRKRLSRGPKGGRRSDYGDLVRERIKILIRLERIEEAARELVSRAGRHPAAIVTWQIIFSELVRKGAFLQATEFLKAWQSSRPRGAKAGAGSWDAKIFSAKLNLIRILITEGLFETAEPMARALAKEHPEESDAAHTALLELLLGSGRPQAARKVLEGIDSSDPGLAVMRLEVAEALLGAADFDAAASVLRGTQGQGSYKAELMRGRLEAGRGRLKRAEESFREACRIASGDWAAHFSLAEVLLRSGRSKEMLSLLRKAKKGLKRGKGAAPSELEAAIKMSLCLGDISDAAEAAEDLLASTRVSIELDMLYRPTLLNFDHFESADVETAYKERLRGAIADFIRERPDSIWGYYFRRIIHGRLQVEETEEAASDDARKIAALVGKEHDWVRFWLGQHALGKRDFRSASRHFKAAAAFSEPGDWRSQCHLGEVELCLRDLGKALQAFGKADSLVPPMRAGQVTAWKAALLLWAGRYRDCLKTIEGIDQKSSSHLAHCWEGGALVKLKRFKEALRVLDRGIDLIPSDGEARIFRAEALLRTKQIPEALREIAMIRKHGYSSDFYVDVIAGLCHKASGDRVGLGREYNRVPDTIRRYVAKKRKIGQKEGSRDQGRILEAILDLSQGVRRGGYETAIWMD